MRAVVCLVALCSAASLVLPASAQTFPAPGTGTFTWERIRPDPPGLYPNRFKPEGIAFDGAGRLYATSDSTHVFESSPGGLPAGTWRGISRPGYVPNNTVLPLGTFGDTLLVGLRGWIDRSVDGGATWRRVTAPPDEGGLGGPDHAGAFFQLPTAHPYAGRILSGPGIYSDDRGVTWARATGNTPPGGLPDAHTFAVLTSGRVLFGGYWGVAASDDGGASYAASPLYGNYRYEVDGVAALATPGSRQSGTPACGLSDGALCDGAVAVGVDAFGDGTYAWRSNDGGRSWSVAVRLAQPNDGIGYGIVAGVVDLGPGPDGLGRAIAVLGRGMVYKTADGGQTWEAIGRLLMDRMHPEQPGSDYAEYVALGPDGHLWVLVLQTGPSSNTIYRSAEPALDAFAVASDAPPRTSEARISVEPNPTSGRASVRLVAEAQSPQATVSVVDALGRHVATLHDGALAAGEHTFVLDTSGMPSGTYVVHSSSGQARTFTVSR